jgi:hypothetical protein
LGRIVWYWSNCGVPVPLLWILQHQIHQLHHQMLW